MRFFITGTSGFIGFHLATRLLQDGHHVTGFDAMTPYYDVRLKEDRRALLKNFEHFNDHIAPLEDMPSLERALQGAEADVIVHLAAQAGVRYSLENPKSYVESNLVGSWNILELARTLQPKHVMLASTSSVYGGNTKIPFEEGDSTDQPLTLYAASKKSMELMAHSYAHLFKIPTTAFRFFTVYGPWGRPDMALFKFVDAILQDRPIDVYGYGEMSRDFTYIDDLIEAVVRLASIPPAHAQAVAPDAETDASMTHAPFRVVNIGGGQPVKLTDFIECIEQELGKTAQRTLLPMQQGDVPNTFAEPSLLKSLTDYLPATPVEVGVRAFVEWYKDYQTTR